MCTDVARLGARRLANCVTECACSLREYVNGATEDGFATGLSLSGPNMLSGIIALHKADDARLAELAREPASSIAREEPEHVPSRMEYAREAAMPGLPLSPEPCYARAADARSGPPGELESEYDSCYGDLSRAEARACALRVLAVRAASAGAESAACRLCLHELGLTPPVPRAR